MSDATPGQTKPSAGAARPAGEAVKEHALRDVFRSADLRKLLPKLALNSFLSNLLALAVPLAILQVLDRVVANKSLGTLALLAVGVVAALILEEVLRSLNGIVTAWLGTRYEHSASIAALERLMHVPMQHYQRQEPGGYAEKVLAAAKVADFYSGQALLVLFDLPFVVIFLSLISVIGGWLVVVPTTLLLIFALMIAHFGRWMRKEVEQRNIVDDRRYNFLAEVLGGIHSVKGLMMEPAMQRRYERLQEANAEQGERLTHGSTIASGVGTLFSQVMIVGVVFFGSWVVTSGNMTPGGLAACILLSVRSLQPLRRSLSVWLRYQSFSAAYARLCEVMSMPWVSDEGKPLMPAVAEGIELRDIEVGYGGGRKLFSGLSLSIPAGECIAIQGESGDGKSTLLSLLNGIVQPNLGTVLVDGSTLDRFSEASVHKEIAYLPQSGVVIAGTILENLTMFDDSLNAKALDVAKKMGLDKVVAGMRHGYETVLGQSATETLPHGVRQLITIVRALTREPSVLLFDEANISLDIEADRLLRNYLEGLKGRCTMVLVTHRPSLLTATSSPKQYKKPKTPAA